MGDQSISTVFDKAKEKYFDYYLFPFLCFGITAASAELFESIRDILILQCPDTNLQIFGEAILGFIGSIAYFAILTMYSEVNDWSDIFEVILNLLAYQFILEADEWAYKF